MANFDPKKTADEASKNRDLSKLGLPASEFLIAMKDFDLKESQRGKPYIKAEFVVIAGPAKGKKFKDAMSLDLDNSGSMARLSMLCNEIGQEETFDLDDESMLRKVLLGKPFKARVNRKIENGYVNNGVERLIVGDKVSAAEREIMESWIVANAEERSYDSGSGGTTHAGGGGGYDEDAPPPTDDDLPF